MANHRQTYESLHKRTTIENECIRFTGPKDKDGYGISAIQSRKMSAHRASWLLYGNSIAEGQYLLHTCKHRDCINPAHLYVGTQKQNVQDQIDAGTFVYGELNGTAKLTEEQVREIRAERMSARYYADKFNLSYHTVWDVLKGRSWKHIK